jgi:novobiocin biosynthesis protein NovU/D-mycarose 3-C-methyltransferase
VRTTCRGCGGDRLVCILSLGRTALANAFVPASDGQDQPTYPLDLYYCENCSLVQLVDVIDPSVLFSHYLYVSGTSETIRAHHEELAATVTERLGLQGPDLVIEAASNDGNLLRAFQARGVRVLGIEPAANIAAGANAEAIQTVCRFFNSEAAADIRRSHGPARVVIGKNVLAHVDDPVDFLRGCALLIAPGGEAIIEVPSLRDLVEKLEYDTVYHEHLSYFSVSALMHLFDRAGLVLTDVTELPVHGGSLRLYATHADGTRTHAASARALAERERQEGLTSLPRLRQFAGAVAAHRGALVDLLQRVTSDGSTVAGFGASAKGNTLLGYCGIDRRTLQYIVDRNPLKVGRLTPGTHIPVVAFETLQERPPDYLLILAWNFADEIMRQAQAFADRGGRFIVPVPVPRVVQP